MQVCKGKATITVSLPSGQSCIISVQLDTRVEQLQQTVERCLKVPKPLQRFIAGIGGDAVEIPVHHTLLQAGVQDGDNITIARSWPKDEGAIISTIELLSKSEANHNQLVIESILELLDRESARIQIAAIEGLSWMGDAGAMHAESIARIVHSPSCPSTVKMTAMEALSWMGKPGAAFASTLAMHRTGGYGLNVEQSRAVSAIRDMCWSEDSGVRHAAMESFVERQVHNGFVVIRVVPLMIEACFDENAFVRQTASTALAQQVRFLDDTDSCATVAGMTVQGWPSNAGLSVLDWLSDFGDKILKSKACVVSIGDLQKTLFPLLSAISLAAGGGSTPPQAESKSLKKMCSVIREAAINLLGRLFQTTTNYDRGNYLHYLNLKGVHNKSSHVRVVSIQWLVDTYPEAASAALSVSKLMKKDKKEEVLKAARAFFEAYADMVDFSSSGAVNTDVVQLTTGNDEESEYYWSYDDFGHHSTFDIALSSEEYYWEAQASNPTKGHRSVLHDAPLDKKAIRKKAQWQQAATADVREHAESHKGCDRRRRGARDAKCADVGRLLLGSSLGQEA